MKMGHYNPEMHQQPSPRLRQPGRRSVRLKGHDYAGGGLYFVTLCAHREAGNLFADEAVKKIVAERIRITEEKFPDAQWQEWVIMPDHFHALIRMDGGGLRLGDIIGGGFKSAVSRELRRKIEATQASPVLEALEGNRILILDMRNQNGDLAAAEVRNRFVIECADELFVPYTSPRGMLERIFTERQK
jgi:hypothetical protein